MTNEDKIDQLFSLLTHQGKADYIGEPISQIEHAFQSAQLAENANAPTEIIIAALFHDIGHLLGSKYTMDNFGAVEHESIGAEYLSKLGFSSTLCELVKGHVIAKRYLTFKYSSYREKLSEASKQTLVLQGGPMTEEEANQFELDPLFDWHLKMRAWDDLAKKEHVPLPDPEKYMDMCRRLLQKA